MDKIELAELEEQLMSRREELRAAVQRSQEQVRGSDVTGDAKDEGDRAASAYEKEFLFHVSNDNRQALNNVEVALARIGKGDFGICVACGEDIEKKRLKALPWARYCLVCQDKKERGVLEEET